MIKPDIYFYIPKDKYRDSWPKQLSGDWGAFGGGANVWTYLTYIALKEHGFKAELTTKIPDEGIVLTHARYLPQRKITNEKTLLVCLRADYGRNHFAEMHVVQNKEQIVYRGKEIIEHLFMPGPSYYLPHWPQPNLIPRSPGRNTLDNIAYLGAIKNLDKEFQQDRWRQQLAQLGINFMIVTDPTKWNDYSEIDAVLAVRPKKGDPNCRKPPSKLVNAWLARVPAILGKESAYYQAGSPGVNYLEVQDAHEALLFIKELKENYQLLEDLVGNGNLEANKYTYSEIAVQWISFIDDFAIPYYYRWIREPPLVRSTRRILRDIRGAFKGA